MAQQYDGTKFWLSQGFSQSTRLHLQHWKWQYQIGYTLHPKIKTSEPLKIADVACGNGAWLLETAKQHPQHEYMGLDVTRTHFPNSSWLPANVELQEWNALTEVGELAGKFDIVHIRAFTSIIRNNDESKIAENLLLLLKPGGYLQWEEADILQTSVKAPNGVDKTYMQRITDLMHALSKYQGQLLNEWLVNLGPRLQERGCTVVEDETSESKPELSRVWSDNMLNIWYGMMFMLTTEKTSLSFPGMDVEISQSIFQGWLEGAVKEAEAGIWASMPYRSVLVKKND